MISALLALLLLWQAAAPANHSPGDVQQYSRYQRTDRASGWRWAGLRCHRSADDFPCCAVA